MKLLFGLLILTSSLFAQKTIFVTTNAADSHTFDMLHLTANHLQVGADTGILIQTNAELGWLSTELDPLKIALSFDHISGLKDTTLFFSDSIFFPISTSAGTFKYAATLQNNNCSKEFGFAYNPVFTSYKKSFSFNNSIQIFPNPASTEIYIQHTQAPATIKLFSMDGVLVKELYINHNKSLTTLSISGLESGCYLIQIESNSFSEIRKQIITN